MTRYSIHPMEKNFQDWDRSERLKRDSYWQLIRTLKREWETTPAIEWAGFDEYVRAVAGIEVIYIGGSISSTYNIVDPEQHLICKLKYGT